jgi:hypothetical protein
MRPGRWGTSASFGCGWSRSRLRGLPWRSAALRSRRSSSRVSLGVSPRSGIDGRRTCSVEEPAITDSTTRKPYQLDTAASRRPTVRGRSPAASSVRAQASTWGRRGCERLDAVLGAERQPARNVAGVAAAGMDACESQQPCGDQPAELVVGRESDLVEALTTTAGGADLVIVEQHGNGVRHFLRPTPGTCTPGVHRGDRLAP